MSQIYTYKCPYMPLKYIAYVGSNLLVTEEGIDINFSIFTRLYNLLYTAARRI